MQYHRNINKEEGENLYGAFVDLCRKTVQGQEKSKDCDVKAGTYGNRQVFSTDTNGPFTHLIEFWHNIDTLDDYLLIYYWFMINSY